MGLVLEEPTPRKDICLVPSIETNEEVLSYVNYTLPYSECKNSAPPLIRQKPDRISRIIFKYLNTTYLDCCFTRLKRENSGLEINGRCQPFKKEIGITSEFVKVNCSYDSKLLYEDYFAFPQKKKNLTTLQRYNVLLLGIRAVSRVNAYRRLTNFTNYLRYNLRAIEFSKYHAINREILDNALSIFTGMEYGTFMKECIAKNTTDGCEFIWNEYAREGFKVLLAEDCVDHGIFNRLPKFKNTSVDYNLLPFMKTYDDNLGNMPNGDCYLCAASRKVYKVLMDYYMIFVKNMRDINQKHFSILWINSLTKTGDPHSGLNMLGLASDDLVRFFKSLQYQGFLKDTMVIVLSDSGYMNRDLKSIKQFAVESMQPMLFVLPPSEAKQRKSWIRNTLFGNSDKLVTAYDIHKTMKAVMKLNDSSLNSPETIKSNKSISLLDKVPHRFCKDVGIHHSVCVCKYIPKYMSRRSSRDAEALSLSYLYLSLGTVCVFLIYLMVKCCDIIYQ